MFPHDHLTVETHDPVAQFLTLSPAEPQAAKAALATLPPSSASTEAVRGAQGAHGALAVPRARPRGASIGARTVDGAGETESAVSAHECPARPLPVQASSGTWTLAGTSPTDRHPYGCLEIHAPTGLFTLEITSQNTHTGVKYSLSIQTPSTKNALIERESFATVAITLSKLF